MSNDWSSAGQRWLEREALKEAASQKRAWVKSGRSTKTFRYDPPQWHRDAVEALGRNDEETFKAIKLGKIGWVPLPSARTASSHSKKAKTKTNLTGDELRSQLAERARQMPWRQFTDSLSPDEHRELTFFGGSAVDFWRTHNTDETLRRQAMAQAQRSHAARFEVIPSMVWRRDDGATASPYGAAPWTSPSEERRWKMVERGFTVRDTVSGTVGIGRQPWKTRAEAQEWADAENTRLVGLATAREQKSPAQLQREIDQAVESHRR